MNDPSFYARTGGERVMQVSISAALSYYVRQRRERCNVHLTKELPVQNPLEVVVEVWQGDQLVLDLSHKDVLELVEKYRLPGSGMVTMSTQTYREMAILSFLWENYVYLVQQQVGAGFVKSSARMH